MVITAMLAFLGSIFIAFVLLLMIKKERRRGRRFFAVGLRSWLDTKVENFGRWIVKSLSHFTKYIVQLNWYYSIHSILRAILKVIIAAYTYMENIFEKNRSKTKQLRAEKRQLKETNHLHQMAEHKQDTTLTAVQQQRLKKKQLEGKQ